MGVTILSHLDERFAEIRQKIQTYSVDYLVGVGERLYADVIESKTYTDRTGRLTASIGYGVVQNGKLVHTGGFGGGEGEQEGRRLLDEAAQSYSGADTTALILVAGMPYAVYVSRKGYNVLDHTRLSIHQML